MYKLIAIDMDGTLLHDDHSVSEQSKILLRKLSRLGSEIVLCTGRGPVSTKYYTNRLGITGCGITFNGAVTFDFQQNTIMNQYTIVQTQLEPYLAYCREHDIHFDINTPFEIYVEQVRGMRKTIRDLYSSFFISPKLLPARDKIQEPLIKFTMMGSSQQLDQTQKHFQDMLGLNMTRSGETFIDVLNVQANKGNALQRLAQIRGIEKEEILAIGNYYNDISMLKAAGLRIAMENSPEELKRIADDVTLSNNEDGVFYALQKYCGPFISNSSK
ncbi:Cof-type HAD-IIB family hydrolase [Paenibacillus popilliae]|uniref:Predicted hydrolase n=1 Tax=Paenibacillus popilliae ATCC 14706 TaxID=1212764 RepID=M9M7L6_PAEPP|nr:Cof-type HAD-IIB family hydrolase [Paenibacillus popilliae]GAC43748.1 predicted hydrolase [Paenibacillus popilliae ATCC 14706]